MRIPEIRSEGYCKKLMHSCVWQCKVCKGLRAEGIFVLLKWSFMSLKKGRKKKREREKKSRKRNSRERGKKRGRKIMERKRDDIT